MPSDVVVLAEALTRLGGDLEALGRAWARVMPAVVLVPAFGLRALPVPARTVMGLAFAACILPAVVPWPAAHPLPWPAALLSEVARGLPIAVAAAVPLWAATMTGGLLDALRASQDTVSAPTVEGRATPLGVPLSLLACAIFLGTGGPARVVAALVEQAPEGHPVAAAAENVVGGITMAVALGGPLLAASVVVEVASALVARAAAPAQVHALLAPVRAIAALAVLGLVFERLAGALAKAIEASP